MSAIPARIKLTGIAPFVLLSKCALQAYGARIQEGTVADLEKETSANLDDSARSGTAISVGELEVRMEQSLEHAYSDLGTGSHSDVSVWRPYVLPDEYRIGYIATRGYMKPTNKPVPVVKDVGDGSALTAPLEFCAVWTDRKTGGRRDGQMWKPQCMDGYAALGDVMLHARQPQIGTCVPPDEIDSNFRCVKTASRDSLVQTTTLGDMIWMDKGSLGSYDGSLWHIRGSDFFVTHNSHRRPSWLHHQFKIAPHTKKIWQDLVLVKSLTNTNDFSVDMEYTMQVGMEDSRKKTWDVSHEVSYSIKAKVSAGLFDCVGASVESELKWGMKTANGGETRQVNTQHQTFRLKQKCPAKHVCEIKQMIYKDGQGASPEFTCHTAVFKVFSRPL